MINFFMSNIFILNAKLKQTSEQADVLMRQQR